MESMVSHDLAAFFKGKKVFVTGCTGFKGSWLSLLLTQLGAQVTGFALEPEEQSLFNILNLRQDIHYISGDIKDIAAVNAALATQDFDLVFHLAAQALVRASYEFPEDTYYVNVLGTVNLFEAIRKSSSIAAVVNVTTDKCYANQESIWPYRETDSLGGFDPYSASKACSEIVTASYRQAFFNARNIGLASARAGNVIGGGDFSKDRIIPDIVRSLMADSEITIRNPFAVRPWQHVLDVLNGYLILAQKLFTDRSAYSEAFNFAPVDRKDITVQELVNVFGRSLGIQSLSVQNKSEHLHETKILKLDPSKAVNKLGWWPRFDPESAINKTAAWYKELLANKDMRQVSQTQIAEFINLI